MNRRVLWVSTLLLPTLAVGLVGYFWFAGPTAPILAAKLWVFPSSDGVVSVRAFVGTLSLGQPPPPTDVVLVVADVDGNLLRRSATTSSDGVADFSLHLNTAIRTLALEYPRPSRAAESLVSGPYEPLEAAAWITPSQLPALRPKAPFADLLVEIPFGVLAVPFLSQVRVRHGEEGCFARLTGAHVSEPEHCCASGCGVYPTEHIVEVELGHSSTDKLGSVLLPVVPGAMPVHVSSEQVYVLSATPRTTAHVAWITENEVLGFGSVNLLPNALPVLPGPPLVRAGTPVYWGAIAKPPTLVGHPDAHRVWVVTSSDADFVSGATVAWPLDPASGSGLQFRPQSISGALDGFAQERARARDRVRAARSRLALALGVILVAEVLSLWGYVRQARAEQAIVPTRQSQLWWLVIVCLVLGFGGMAALFWWK